MKKLFLAFALTCLLLAGCKSNTDMETISGTRMKLLSLQIMGGEDRVLVLEDMLTGEQYLCVEGTHRMAITHLVGVKEKK